MKIYFLRQGEADWPNWTKPDSERPLNKKGRKEMERIGKFLQKLDPQIDICLTSPLPRASQTAEIAAEYLKLKLKTEPALGPTFNATKLRNILQRVQAEDVMIVGHEPSFSEVIGELTGGEVKLSKAGLALVELEDAKSSGRLLWLIPPKIAKLCA